MNELKQFGKQQPKEWQHISVWDGENWLHGYYRNSGHHTYPHDVCSKKHDPFSDIEGYTDEAEWRPSHDNRR